MSLDSVPSNNRAGAGASVPADLSRNVFVRVSPEDAIVQVHKAATIFVFVHLDPEHHVLFGISKKEALMRLECQTTAYRERWPEYHLTPCTIGLMIGHDGVLCIGTAT